MPKAPKFGKAEATALLRLWLCDEVHRLREHAYTLEADAKWSNKHRAAACREAAAKLREAADLLDPDK